MATVTFSAAGETLYAYLAGEIDHDAAQSLRMQLDDALVSRSPRTLIIDLGGVGFMDSSGIGLILGRQRCARVLGTSLRLQHAPAQLQKVLRLAGIPCTENIEKENAQRKQRTAPASSSIPLAATRPTPAALRRPFWRGMTQPCPNWPT